jgi:hypothetical protein
MIGIRLNLTDRATVVQKEGDAMPLSSEFVIHDALAQILQEVMTQYGVRVIRIDADWTDVSTIGTAPLARLTGLEITSSKQLLDVTST